MAFKKSDAEECNIPSESKVASGTSEELLVQTYSGKAG